MNFLDGNMLAGPLADVFVAAIAEATAVCDGCGREDPIAAWHVYGPGPGLVARCPGCHQVTLRLVAAPGAFWLDLRGVQTLRLPDAELPYNGLPTYAANPTALGWPA